MCRSLGNILIGRDAIYSSPPTVYTACRDTIFSESPVYQANKAAEKCSYNGQHDQVCEEVEHPSLGRVEQFPLSSARCRGKLGKVFSI